MPDFFARLNADKGERLSHLALRWTMLTMVRTQETRFAEWSEFEGLDGPEPLWRLSPERMKMRAEHIARLHHRPTTDDLLRDALGGCFKPHIHVADRGHRVRLVENVATTDEVDLPDVMIDQLRRA